MDFKVTKDSKEKKNLSYVPFWGWATDAGGILKVASWQKKEENPAEREAGISELERAKYQLQHVRLRLLGEEEIASLTFYTYANM